MDLPYGSSKEQHVIRVRHLLAAAIVLLLAPSVAVARQAPAARQEVLRFSNDEADLVGTLTLPATPGPHPVVIFVAGSGPSTRTGYGILPRIWEEFARRGIASFAWDKPGTGQSTGNWRNQTTESRRREVLAAVALMKANPGIDGGKIGTWGISQAGWIMPAIAAASPDIAFMISVSGPGGTGAEQELYRIEQSLKADGYPLDQIEAALDFTRKRNVLLQTNAGFDRVEALEAKVQGQPWLKEVGDFDKAAYERLRGANNPDMPPIADLERLTIPILAIYGERDTVVDWRESAKVYRAAARKAGNKDLSIVSFPNGDHSLFPSITGGQAEMEAWFALEHKLFAPGYLDAMADWLTARFLRK